MATENRRTHFFGIARGAANALAKAWGVDRDWSLRRAMLK